MTGKRTRYSADFKSKVALEALRGELTTAQLAAKHGIHQTMVGEWKRQAMEGLTAVFSGKATAQESAKVAEAEVEKLHAKIGQLVVERDFLAKASPCCTGLPRGRFRVGWRRGEPSMTEGRPSCRSKSITPGGATFRHSGTGSPTGRRMMRACAPGVA
jgi:transposase